MLYAFSALLALQLAGELLVRLFGLPFPGALMGTLLLLAALLWLGRLPLALEQTASVLLQNMMLLFIPIIAGVMLHFDRIAQQWQPFVIAGVISSMMTYAATALAFRWMMAREKNHSVLPCAFAHASADAATSPAAGGGTAPADRPCDTATTADDTRETCV